MRIITRSIDNKLTWLYYSSISVKKKEIFCFIKNKNIFGRFCRDIYN